ncbi:hypothetical protein C5C56_06195 [Rathayibacter sp. AY1D1]|uniref:hypothetical protein n=1 Tax=unclassified Rathayibacter TaxID=2609250 RepID=UPI000CE85B2E|nr:MULTISPECIES: hypothetical protein [unclassified Rathayibacter]PPG84223.1 hypothetical protein C5C52_01415 [Rathayibacter sp. AY1E5]PPI00627.1 hypothetical protein C5C56_06195 [Rathayibacter sp. AY1D1]
MSYTLVEITATTLPLVAIFEEVETSRDGRLREALPVIAFGLFRDPEDRGAPNISVPLTPDDFNVFQQHYYASRRTLEAKLPYTVVYSDKLFDEVAEITETDSSAAVALDAVSGTWAVVR